MVCNIISKGNSVQFKFWISRDIIQVMQIKGGKCKLSNKQHKIRKHIEVTIFCGDMIYELNQSKQYKKIPSNHKNDTHAHIANP